MFGAEREEEEEEGEEGGVFVRGSGLFSSKGGGGGLFDDLGEEGEGEREGEEGEGRRSGASGSKEREDDLESSVRSKTGTRTVAHCSCHSVETQCHVNFGLVMYVHIHVHVVCLYGGNSAAFDCIVETCVYHNVWPVSLIRD